MSYKKTAFYEVFTIIFGLLALSVSGAFLVNIIYYLVLANFNFSEPLAEVLKPRGEFVEVDGHRMHIYCTGEGDEVAILEADKDDWSIYWASIQSKVSGFSKVCSYDRLGKGWSDGQVENDAESAETLHKLLSAAGLPGPYILVGHAWGAENIMRFNEQYSNEVKGLIFYDYPYAGEEDLMNKYKNDEINHPLIMISSPLKNLAPVQAEQQDKIRTELYYYLKIWQPESIFLLIDDKEEAITLKAISSAIDVFEAM